MIKKENKKFRKMFIVTEYAALTSGFLIYIQNDILLFSAGCRAGNTGVQVIPNSFRQTVSQSDLKYSRNFKLKLLAT